MSELDCANYMLSNKQKLMLAMSSRVWRTRYLVEVAVLERFRYNHPHLKHTGSHQKTEVETSLLL